jgi:serine protease Do
MNRLIGLISAAFLLTGTAVADVSPQALRKLYDTAGPSLVAVQYTWEYEFGKVDFVGAGVVVSEDGLILMPVSVITPGIPDAQLTDFKIIIPHFEKDDEEIDAVFQGRDERSNVAFVKASGKHDWKPIKFEDVDIQIGEPVLSAGLLPKSAGYRTYIIDGVVASRLRGDTPQVVVTSGGLGAIGSPVFNLDGKALGFVNFQRDQQMFLHTSAQRRQQQAQENPVSAAADPPHLFTPAKDFLISLNDPPTPEKPVAIPWIGAPQLSGLKKDAAEFFGLENTPAVEVGDVIPGGPADKAGLKVGMKIVKLNGEPLERGDSPDEAAMILTRKITRMKVGSAITLSVLTEKDKPVQDIKITLEQRPRRANLARRFYADDLGFSAREIVFEDTYVRKQPPDLKGVVISLIKPQSAAATAKLQINDLVTQFNNTPITDLDQFEKDYKAFRKEKPNDAIVLVVLRPDGTNQTIRIEPPR